MRTRALTTDGQEVESNRNRYSIDRVLSEGLLAWSGCGSILIVAAMLKTGDIVTAPPSSAFAGLSKLLLVGWELLLAGWLLAGVASKVSRLAALATFSVFATYSLTLWMQAAPSCGCFGQVQASPWLILILDASMVYLLWRWKPTSSPLVKPLSCRWPAVVCSVLGALAISFILFEFTHGNRFQAASSRGSLIVVEPERWIGKDFPIIANIDVGEQLASGSWIVLLYHHDCSECQEWIGKYCRLTEQLKEKGGRVEIALIEVPPYSALSHMTEACRRGQLSDDFEWFVRTPLAIVLQNGKVRSVAADDNSLSVLAHLHLTAPVSD